MTARLLKFLRGRGMRKLARNRLAMVSLAVILVYVFVVLAIMVFGLLTLEDTLERIGPNSMPGFFLTQKPEKRLEDVEQTLLDPLDRALKRRSAADAVRELRLGELQVVDAPREELQAGLEKAYALVDQLYESDDLDHDPAMLPVLEQLEDAARALYVQPTGWSGAMHTFNLCLGTDRQGRSIAIRALYSTKVAIQIGFVVACISVLLGAILGAAAAFIGSWVDHLVIWLYSTFSAIPGLVLLTVLVYMFTGGPWDGTLIPVYTALCMTFWIGTCRVIRGEAMKIKELEYVQAATAVGFGRIYILFKHVLPNTLHLVFIQFSLLFIGAIKSEVILSFLGLGVKKGPSWGIMISQSRQEVINGFYWQLGAATALMFGLVLAFNILSDALQDAFDPKHVG